MRFFLLPLLLSLPIPAISQEYPSSFQIGSPDPIVGMTFILLRETAEPGAEAELFFYNADVNDPSDEGDYTLEWEGIRITITFIHNDGYGGPDSIVIQPPPGYFADPPKLTIMEGYDGVSYIFPLGMS